MLTLTMVLLLLRARTYQMRMSKGQTDPAKSWSILSMIGASLIVLSGGTCMYANCVRMWKGWVVSPVYDNHQVERTSYPHWCLIRRCRQPCSSCHTGLWCHLIFRCRADIDEFSLVLCIQISCHNVVQCKSTGLSIPRELEQLLMWHKPLDLDDIWHQFALLDLFWPHQGMHPLDALELKQELKQDYK